MRPQLKHGRPVGQNFLRLPKQAYICQCSECIHEWAWNPTTNNLIHGKLCGRKEYDRHQRILVALPSESANDSEPPVDDPNSDENEATIQNSVLQSPMKSERIRSTNDASVIHVVRDLIADCRIRCKDIASVAPAQLVFATPPSPDQSHSKSNSQIHSLNGGPCALDHNCDANRVIIEYERWLLQSLERVDAIEVGNRPAISTEKAAALGVLQSEVRRLYALKIQEWEKRVEAQVRARQKYQKLARTVVDTAPYMTSLNAKRDPVVFIIYVVVAIFHVICHVSMDHCNWLLQGIRAILYLFCQIVCASSSPPDIPIDVRTVIEGLQLKPVTKAFCCCPKCFHCYDLGDFPDRCTAQASPGASLCGRQLRKQVFRSGASRKYAVRRYLYHDMKSWVARLLSRPGMEEYLDRDVWKAEPEPLRDIWDGDMLRDFLGPDGLPFTARVDGHEGRYVFGLNMDGFSPYGNKIGGSKSSCGAIYLVCLNLPPYLRYLPENTFLVSIIPGPHHPSLVEINHLLKPLVDDLLELWKTGVWYTRTCKYPQGRLVRCALVPIICDLPAARQMMAFASHSARRFCCYCSLDKHDMDNLDIETWPAGIKDREEYVRIAEQWRDGSKKDRAKIFTRYGIRYSELLRLPYWNPIKFVVIDSMHANLLTIVEHQCRSLWGMDLEAEDGDGLRRYEKAVRKPLPSDMLKAWEVMERGNNDDVMKLPMKVLKELCEEVGIPTGGQRNLLLQQLFQYRRKRLWVLGPDDKPVNPLQKRPKPKGKDPVTVEERTAAERYFSSSACTSATTLANKYRKEVLIDLHSRHILLKGHVSQANQNKNQLASQLLEARDMYKSIVVDGSVLGQPSVSKKPVAVLGERILGEVHADMERTVIPDWLGRPPGNLGGSHRSLSADQWRTACTIHLVITLIRVWGTLSEDDRHRKMLDNFMDLVIATKVAHMRSLTSERIEAYEIYMTRYLKTMQELYPNSSIHPYHHLALHLPTFLRGFGPVHGWRCFPFERYNHMLQQIPTNNKFGDMESTMLKRFCEAQNLRALIAGLELPAALNFFKATFMKTFAGDARGSLLNDVSALGIEPVNLHHSSHSAVLDESIYRLLWSRLVKEGVIEQPPRTILRQPLAMHPKITALGVTYSTVTNSQGNSLIISGDFPAGRWIAGSISEIFVWSIKAIGTQPEHKIPFFIVQQYQELTTADAAHDPYRNWSTWAAGKLFYNDFVKGTPLLLTLDDIVCHFAATAYSSDSIETECIHVLPLDRD